MSPTQRQVLVYGAGAVGSIFGWRLAHHGYGSISVVCRSNYERVRDVGFSFQTRAWGNGSLQPREVYKAGHRFEPRSRKFDLVVCATKITSERDYALTIRDLEPVIGPNTTLISAQNGMDVEEPLQRAFPSNTILSAICNIGCTQAEPGNITQTSLIKPHAFHIGIHTAGRGLRESIATRNSLAAVDSKFKSIESVNEERWRKLIFNSAFNSTCALTGLNTHELLRHVGVAELVFQIASEACRVAAASGVDFGEDFPSKIIALAQTSPAIIPSTLQDLLAGRPIELGPIFGSLVTKGVRLGVPTPHLRVVYDLLWRMNERVSIGGQTGQVSLPPHLLSGITREQMAPVALSA